MIAVETEPASQPPRSLPDDVADMLRDALSRFDDLITVRDGSATSGAHIHYRVALRQAEGGAVSGLNVRLVSLVDGVTIWRQDLQPAPAEAMDRAWKLAAVRSIATQLAQPYGIIPADARGRFRFEGPTGEAYRCLLAGFDYWRKADAASHLAVRQCLFDHAGLERPLPATLAQLTYMHLEEFRHGFNPLGGDPRERARAAAERAVALAPGSARAHQALLASHFASRRFTEAFAAGARAIELNPFDAEILADVGARHIQVDDIARGLPMIETAIVQMPAPPIWARVYLALGYYAEGRRDDAARVADQISGDTSPLALIARVLATYHRRDAAGLKDLLGQLRAKHPAIEKDPGAYLDRLVISPSLTRRLLDSLALARTQALE
jgi:tetratricopeptide (TPR) repeat protein